MRTRTRSDIGMYSVLLVTSLGIAWWASTPRSAGDAREVRIASVNPADIIETEWQGGKNTMVARRRETDGRFWIKAEKDEFLAGQKFDDALATFNPLLAKRVIAETVSLSDDQWKAFGLKPALGKLTLKMGGKEDGSTVRTWSLETGNPAFGTTERYALSPDGKKVILIDGDAISSFENPVARFFDRVVLSGKVDDADSAELEKGSLKKRFTKASDKEKNPSGGPFNEKSFNEWIEKFERLRAIRYADPATEEKLANQQPELVLKLLDGEKVAEEFALKKMPGSGSSPDATQVTWWVFSSKVKAHLEISANRAEPVVKDAESLL